MQIEHENIGLAEILYADEPDGLYYLAKDIIPLFKTHIKEVRKKNKDAKTFGMHLPTVWSYSSWLTEDYFSGGLEGDSEWDYLGILDMFNVTVLDDSVRTKIDFKEEDIVWE